MININLLIFFILLNKTLIIFKCKKRVNPWIVNVSVQGAQGIVEKHFERTKGLFGSYFQELFFVIENKKHKTLIWETMCVFIFCIFCVIKNHFFENNKKMFSLFFHCSNHRFFLCGFFFFLMFSTKMSSTQLPQSIDF